MLKVTKKVSLAKFELPCELSQEVKAGQLTIVKNGMDSILAAESEKLIQFEPTFRAVELLCRYGQNESLYQSVDSAVKSFCELILRPIVQQELNDNRIPLPVWENYMKRIDQLEGSFACLYAYYCKSGWPSLLSLSSSHFDTFSLGAEGRQRLLALSKSLIGPGNVQIPPSLLMMLHSLSYLSLVMNEGIKSAIDSLPLKNSLSDAWAVYISFMDSFAKILPTEQYQHDYSNLWKAFYLSKYAPIVENQMLLALKNNWSTEFEACMSICDHDNFHEYFKRCIRKIYEEQCNVERCNLVMVKMIELKVIIERWNVPGPLVKKAFEGAFMFDSTACASQLAFYFDSLLRESRVFNSNIQDIKAHIAGDDKEMQVYDAPSLQFDRNKYTNGLELFRWLPNKDHFEVVHKRLLARRVIQISQGLLAENLDAEDFIIGEMERVSGPQLTGRLRGMMRECRELSCNRSKVFIREGDCILLTNGIYPAPLNPDSDEGCKFTRGPIADIVEEVEQKFKDKYSKRRMSLCPTLSIMATEMFLPSQKSSPRLVEFWLTLPQTAIMLPLNCKPRGYSIGLKELRAESCIISESLFNRALRSLSSDKLPILLISKDSRVSVNCDLPAEKCPTNRCRVNLYSSKELMAFDCLPLSPSASGMSSTSSSSMVPQGKLIVDDVTLGNQLDAFIIRTLKKQKEMTLEDLKSKSSTQLGVSDAFFKARMKSLSEREYLSIDGNNNNNMVLYKP